MPHRLMIVLACALFTATVLTATSEPNNAVAAGAFVTTDISGPLEPVDLANALVGPGVSISNVTYTGADVAAGTFTGGTGIIDFDSGIILSSGNVANVIGPNVLDGKTTVNGSAGDPDLNLLSGFPTYDAAVLEFDFVANTDKVFFQYVFASDEYNEYVNSSFNDTFAFIIGGTTNCAVVPATATPVSINTINNGNPFGSGVITNPALYINNDLSDGGGTINTEMDGLTVTLLCEAVVTPNVATHMKLAIADASDSVLDSVVFLKQGSFSTTPPPGGVPVSGRSMGFWGNKNGIARISNATGGYAGNAIAIGRGSNIDTQVESLKVLPSLNACGKGTPFIFVVGAQTSLANCTLATGINFGTLNTNASQTLALGYNIKLVTGYTGQTIGALGCGAYLTAGLLGTNTVNAAFAAAVTLIDGSASGGTTTQAQLGAMNLLLKCLNREV